MIENIQREELNAIELAEAYARLIELYSFTQEKLAKKVGISRVALANTLRLNRLPQKVKGMIVGGQLSEGHGRSLLALEKEEKIIEMAEQVLSQKMSVREVEEAVRRALGKETKGTAENPIQIQVKDRVLKEKSSEFLSIEEDLRHKFGTKVQLRGNKTRGMIEIYFTGEDSLSRLLHLLKSVEN